MMMFDGCSEDVIVVGQEERVIMKRVGDGSNREVRGYAPFYRHVMGSNVAAFARSNLKDRGCYGWGNGSWFATANLQK